MRFTNSPYEDFMKEKATSRASCPTCRPKAPAVTAAPTGTGSAACSATGSSFGQRQGANMSRELTRQEKAAIRSLVKRWCANYDKDVGCLPLDCECYMLGKCWTGAYCRYFRSAVLPLDPVLERSLTVERITETRPCPVCGRAFLPDGRQRYCAPACAGAARRQKQRGYMRKYRG